MPSAREVCTFLAAIVIAAPLAAQAASSTNWVVSSPEIAAGGPSGATVFEAVASFELDVLPCPASSTNWSVLGAFPAHTQSPLGSQPWLIAACPKYFTLRGGETLELRGDQLHLGSRTSVTIGGESATVLSRTREIVTVQAPVVDTPGPQLATLSNGGGTSSLTGGFAALPMLDFDSAPCRGVPFDLIYRGTSGDISVWMFSLSTKAVSTHSPWHYGFVLGTTGFTFLFPTVVTSTDGVQRLPLPALPSTTPRIWFQNFTLTTNPGYAPGSFTNAVHAF